MVMFGVGVPISFAVWCCRVTRTFSFSGRRATMSEQSIREHERKRDYHSGYQSYALKDKH